MLQFIMAFILSFVATLLLVRFAHAHRHFTGDNDLVGVQKFHCSVVPRIGGVSIMLGLLSSGIVLWVRDLPNLTGFYLLMLCCFPAFLSGVCEDVFKYGGVIYRFAAIVASGIFAWFLADGRVDRLDVFWLDPYLALPIFSILFSVFAVAGLTNAMNLIDGYNGLASAVSIIMSIGIAYVAFFQGDYLVWSISVSLVGAVVGFFVWNWPRGLIFLGDGGAYLLGFVIAELVILVVSRNSDVSPWFALMIVIYPVIETIFTIIRRLAHKKNPGLPDAAHLHQLIYKALMKWAVGSAFDDISDKLHRNSMTSPYLWALSSMGVVPAVLFWRDTKALQISVVVFVAVYLFVYWILWRSTLDKK